MEIKEFAQKVYNAVTKELGNGFRVELKEIRKNNGVVLHGLLIFSDAKNVIPTIYLETFKAAYEDGISFGQIIRKIMEIYHEEMPGGNVNMEFFRDFQKVRDRICYRLIRRQGNEELLKDIPYVEFLDLAVCFYYAYAGKDLGEGTILLHNSHVEQWNIKTQDLMACAVENTKRLFPARLFGMTEVLKEIMDVEGLEELEAEIPMKVLTNEKKIYGAACMLYPNVLQEIADKCGKSFYIFPSSVHEVIVMEASGRENPSDMKEMICEVNRTQVATEEVLSDTLYFYDKSAKSVKIIF